MPRRPPATQRWLTAASWPLGVGLTSWDYMWRTTPMRRSESSGALPDTLPELLAPPTGVDRSDLQTAADGAGPLFHRTYRTRIRDSRLDAERLMRAVQADPNRTSPTRFARFHRTRGEEGRLRVGDEFVVRMPGPWDGPVRVIDVGLRSFRLATLAGHLEAGQIEFRVRPDGRLLVFEIESWARSATPLVNLLYHRLRMAKEVQAHMWISFLERVVHVAGGRMTGGVEIRTERIGGRSAERSDGGSAERSDGGSAGRSDGGSAERVDGGGAGRAPDVRPPTGPRAQPPPRVRRRLAALDDRPLNFDPRCLRHASPAAGWTITDLCQPLPSEPPGPPLPGGSWEIARRLMRGYEFADPSIVQAFYDPDHPLEGRNMLLKLRAFGLAHIYVGVRVAEVYEQTRELEAGPVRVWGWSYRTLQGHVERGQMDWEVWKWLQDGRVEFHVHAIARVAHIANPFVRLGFRLLRERERQAFLDSTRRRMLTFTELALSREGDAQAMRDAAARLTARPLPRRDGAHDSLAHSAQAGAGAAAPPTTRSRPTR